MQIQFAVSTVHALHGAEEDLSMAGEALVQQADTTCELISQLAGVFRELVEKENQLQALADEIGAVNAQLGEIASDSMDFFTKKAHDTDNLFSGLN